MKKQLTHIGLLGLMFLMGCNTDEKPAQFILENWQKGATVRTKEVVNLEFDINNTTSVFDVLLEIQDQEEGNFFTSVEVFVRFKDNTISGSDMSTGEFNVASLTPDVFFEGEDFLPQTRLQLSYEELLNATGTVRNSVACKDQFLVRLEIRLRDGRSFSTGTATSDIIAFDTFHSSPYCYTINIIEPIDEELFTGLYSYQDIEGEGLVPTWGSGIIEISKGHSINTRYIPFGGGGTVKRSPNYEFTVACDESIFQKNQILNENCASIADPKILLGPDIVNAVINIDDDAVFELWFVQGYLGWDGLCGFGTVPSRVRFTKQ